MVYASFAATASKRCLRLCKQQQLKHIFLPVAVNMSMTSVFHNALTSSQIVPSKCLHISSKPFKSAVATSSNTTVDTFPTPPPKEIGAKLFDKIIIANRGEIACRIIRSARGLGIKTVAVYSDADANSMYVRMADEAVHIGPPPTNESYLVHEKLIEAALRTGAQALHPGYGFLSENSDFAKKCRDNGVEFIGPPNSALLSMGSKSEAKTIMRAAGVPITPAYYGDEQGNDHLEAEALKVGYPVLIKAVTGGGGKGMRVVHDPKDFIENLESCRREASRSFGNDAVLIEKYLKDPRHIELQVFGDAFGNAVHLFERDCSVQRRHQKVLEEAPSPGLPDELRLAMGEAAVKAAKAVGYVGAGTVEFLMDNHTKEYYFCEMNTRLQVEHCVTEMVTGVDLVDWQLRVASGEPLPMTQDQISVSGHAIEARIYAENPANGFLPATGTLSYLKTPTTIEGSVRIDTGVQEGDEITIYYDPMISKLLTWAPTRMAALKKMSTALEQYQVGGLVNNIDFIKRCVEHPAFVKGGIDTGFLTVYEEDVAIPPVQKPTPHMMALSAITIVGNREGILGSKPLSKTAPWTSGSWKNVGERKVKLDMKLNGYSNSDDDTPFDCTVTVNRAKGSYHVQLPDLQAEPVEVQLHSFDNLEKNEIKMVVDGQLYTGNYYLQDKGPWGGVQLQIWLANGSTKGDEQERYTFQINIPERVFGDTASDGAAPKIVAPMPGKVVKVNVAPGDNVQKGDVLVVLEAMKMEHTISSPKDAVVDSIAFSAGEIVDDGVTLVVLKSDE